MQRATVDLANSGLRPKKPLAKFKAHVIVWTTRRSDLDNCIARTKVCWDTLKHCGWIEDDSPDHMTDLTVKNGVNTKWPHLEIHLDTVTL